MNSINDLVCAAIYQKGRNGNGIFDPKRGNSITLTKTVEGKQTKYKAIGGLQFAMPEHSTDPSKTPDIIKFLKKNQKSDEYLRGVIRNYLYGEPMPEKDIWKEDEEETTTAQPARAALPKPKNSAPQHEEEVEDIEYEEEEDETPAPPVAKKPVPPAPTKKPTPTAEAKPKGRSLADDLDKISKQVDDDLDGLEDED
jgi:hypothetical protein